MKTSHCGGRWSLCFLLFIEGAAREYGRRIGCAERQFGPPCTLPDFNLRLTLQFLIKTVVRKQVGIRSLALYLTLRCTTSVRRRRLVWREKVLEQIGTNAHWYDLRVAASTGTPGLVHI